MPNCTKPDILAVLQNCKHFFVTTLGVTDTSCHFLPTIGNSVKVPPCCIQSHYWEEVEKQIQMMFKKDYRENNNPWMAPTVFVPKTSGELVCVSTTEN